MTRAVHIINRIDEVSDQALISWAEETNHFVQEGDENWDSDKAVLSTYLPKAKNGDKNALEILRYYKKYYPLARASSMAHHKWLVQDTDKSERDYAKADKKSTAAWFEVISRIKQDLKGEKIPTGILHRIFRKKLTWSDVINDHENK